MHTFALIANPFARVLRTNPSLKLRFAKLIESGNGDFCLTQNRQQLKAALQKHHDKNTQVIAILGGDGTINLVVNTLIDIYKNSNNFPKILILGGGTANVLALNLGLPRSPLKVMADFIKLNNSNVNPLETRIPCLFINNLYGFVFANGAATLFLEFFYRNKTHIIGSLLLLSKIILGAIFPFNNFIFRKNKTLFSELTKSYPMSITTEHPNSQNISDQKQNISLIYISTLPKAAMHIPIFPPTLINKTRFGLVILQSSSHQLIKQVLRIMLRLPFTDTNVIVKNPKQVHIVTPTYSRYTIDGEVFDGQNNATHVTIGPEFTFVLPFG